MELKNMWDTFKIEKIAFNFDEELYSPIVTFDFEVLGSFEYLKETSYKNVEMSIRDNLPYTMLLKQIFDKCEEIINENIDN